MQHCRARSDRLPTPGAASPFGCARKRQRGTGTAAAARCRCQLPTGSTSRLSRPDTRCHGQEQGDHHRRHCGHSTSPTIGCWLGPVGEPGVERTRTSRGSRGAGTPRGVADPSRLNQPPRRGHQGQEADTASAPAAPRRSQAAHHTGGERDGGAGAIAGSPIEPLGAAHVVLDRGGHHQRGEANAPIAASRAAGRRSAARCSGVARRPITKNGSRPVARARSRVSPVKAPPTEADPRPRPAGRAAIRFNSGVASRHTKRVARYHIGQCGLRNIGPKCSPPTTLRKVVNAGTRTGGTARPPWSAASREVPAGWKREGPRQVAGDHHEGRHVPQVEEVVGPRRGERRLSHQGPGVPYHHERDEQQLGVVEPGVARRRRDSLGGVRHG